MQKKIFLYLLITGLTMSCHFANNHVPLLWFYTYSTASSGNRDTSLTPANFINLEKDGSYTRDFGHYDYGRWTIKENKLTLINYKNEETVFTVNSLSRNEMQLTVDGIRADNFANQPDFFKSESDNPFSKQNNEWRIPALKKESDTEIKNRLLNHLLFWEKYFTWAFKNNIETIDVRSTPTLIKIYGNGFGLKPLYDLPKEWRSFFYDEEDLKKATDMIEYIFDKDNIAWAHTDNKYEMFISAFQQMEDKLKQEPSLNSENISNSKNK
jgi:hypothetical protein